MRDTDLYRQLLGLEKPWTVDRVELDVTQQRVDVFAKHDKPKAWTCPECGKPFGLYDHDAERVWRHLDSCGLTNEQQYDLAVRQLVDRNRHRQRFFVLAIVLVLVLAPVTIFWRYSAPAVTEEAEPATVALRRAFAKTSDLSLNMEVDGDLIPGQRGGRGIHFASGRLYQFLLANSSRECTAVIKDIRLEVLAHVVDEHPAMEARTAETTTRSSLARRTSATLYRSLLCGGHRERSGRSI